MSKQNCNETKPTCSKNLCVICGSDTDWKFQSGQKPKCAKDDTKTDGSKGNTCVQCISNADCPLKSASNCLTNYSCGCSSNMKKAPCVAPTPVCSNTPLLRGCVECDFDCRSCFSGVCKECRTNNDCFNDISYRFGYWCFNNKCSKSCSFTPTCDQYGKKANCTNNTPPPFRYGNCKSGYLCSSKNKCIVDPLFIL